MLNKILREKSLCGIKTPTPVDREDVFDQTKGAEDGRENKAGEVNHLCWQKKNWIYCEIW